MNANILIVNPQDLKVLLVRRDSCWTLPQVPANQRHTEVNGISQAVLAEYGLQITILHCLQDQPRIYVAENHKPNITPLTGRWFGRDDLADITSEFEELLQQYSIGKLMPITPPWARLGWFSKAHKWTAEKLDRAGMPATGPMEQVKVWGLSYVMRIPTSQGWAWFKALPHHVSREPQLTRILNKKYPGSVPPVISTNSSKGWMLTRDFGGRPLCEYSDPAHWAAVLKNYALLQCEEVVNARELGVELVMIGGLNRLGGWVDILASGLIEMANQGVLPMSHALEWHKVIPRIKRKCRQLAAFNIPETLEHGDLYCGNINITEDGVVFFDWTDASISHPFFSLDPFLHECKFSEQVKEQLLSTYLLEWADFLHRGMDEMEKAWELAKPLALVQQTLAYFSIMRFLQPQDRWQAGNSLANLVRTVVKDPSWK